MSTVQECLNNKYSKEVRNSSTELNLSGWNDKDGKWEAKPNWTKLIGELDLSEFPNLEKLDCSYNQITSLDLTNCPKLTELKCWENELTEIKFPKSQLNLKTLHAWTNYLTELNWDAFSKSLTCISISNNNLSRQDLSALSKFTNLEELYLGNDIEERFEKGIINRFHGFLKPLKTFPKLKKLQVEGTNINLLDNLKIISWGKEAIIRKLKLGKEEAEKLRRTNRDNFSVILNDILINYAKKELGLDLTSEQEGEIEKLGSDIATSSQARNTKLEEKLHGLQKHWKHLEEKQKEDRQNSKIASVIPLERLFVIRSNIKQFLKKWGSEDKDGKTELSKLKSPEQFNKFNYFSSVEWASTSITVAGGALTLLDYSTTGGVITLVAPLIGSGASQLKTDYYDAKKVKWSEFLVDADTFLDNYNELLGILKQVQIGETGIVNIALKNLKNEVDSFLKEYDEDGNEEIDIDELTKERKKFSSELIRLEEVAKMMKNLEKEVINYRQGSIKKELETQPQIEVDVSADKHNDNQISLDMKTENMWTFCTFYQRIKNYLVEQEKVKEEFQTNIEVNNIIK